MKRLIGTLTSTATILGALVIASPTATATPDAAPPPTPRAMPSEIPSVTTPGITTGTKVLGFAEVGDKVYAAGTFTAVGGQVRTGIAAFNRTTGALDPTFNPTVVGNVYAVTPGPTASTLYIAGTLRSVNGVSLSRVALVDATTGAVVPGFKPPSFNDGINDLKLRGTNLYVGGTFTTAGGQPRLGLASLNATTGALTSALTVGLTEHHNTNSSLAQKAVGAVSLDITKDGTRMVVVGNFRKANGLDRDQVVQIDLTGASSSVRADWHTSRYTPLCFNWSVDHYVRAVSFSPDGSYFVVGANGGPNPGTLCDTAAKWWTNASGSNLEPAWISHSGGDTIWAVAVAEHAVYIGGHMRWMNNPAGRDSAGAGAVPRSGLAVVDPLNGVPLTWNPGRRPRGTAVFGFLVARDGVWIGMDTDKIGPNREYTRQKMAFFPYVGGYTATATTTPTLPATAYVGRGGIGGATNVLHRVNAGGPLVPSGDNGPDWAADDGDTSPYRNTGSAKAGWSPSATPDGTVPATTPLAIYDSERWDPGSSPELNWEFPVTAGTPISVRLYLADRCGCTSLPGQRSFDVSLDGNLVIDNLDLTATHGSGVATMRSFNIVSDGMVDIDFSHVVENPLVNGIEIIRTDTTPGPVTTDALSSWSFDGTTAGTEQTSGTAIDWSTTRGAFTVGDKLFVGTPGMLKVASFNGSVIGPLKDINPYHDPKWMNIPNGSGGTYDGVTPTFYGALSTVAGMFYDNGFLYYADGQSALKSMPFSPDSGIVGPASSVASGMNFSNVGGMFVVGSTLYYVERSTGDLYAIGWTGRTTTGSPALVSGPSNGGPSWKGRAVFLGNPPANQPPTAAFTAQCAGLTCHLDASGSTDPEGSIASWSWDLGDGATSTDMVLDHTYASGGPVSVTLTVTDAAGLTSSVTQTVTPVETPAGTGYIDRAATDDAFAVLKAVQVPASATTDDTLLLTWVGESSSVPSDPSGWTRLRTVTNGSGFVMVVWTRQATATDPGTTVTLVQPVAKRTVAQLHVYRGFSGVAASAEALDSSSATHVAPAQAVAAGDLVVSIFGDRSSTTSSWTPGSGQLDRGSVLGTSTTRWSTFASDSGARASTGTDPGTTATTNAPSTKGAGVSLVLRP
jgi:PKD repeat protein